MLEGGTKKLLVRIGTDFTGAAAGFNQLNRSMERVAMDAAAVGAALTGATFALGKMAERGTEVANVSAAFARQVGNQELALLDLRRATRGLVTDYDLMVGFNRAATLGAASTREEYAELARTAIALGKALGEEAAFALESLSLGIGRQSRLILDNLGLIVSVADANERYAQKLGKSAAALSEAERREAFRTAALESARGKVAELGDAVDSAGDDWIRFTTEVKNARDELALLVASSGFVSGVFEEWAIMLREWRGVDVSGEAVLGSLQNLPDDLDVLRLRAQKAEAELIRLNLAIGDTPIYARGSRAWKDMVDQLKDASIALSYLRGRIQELEAGAGEEAAGAGGYIARGLAATRENAERLLDRIATTQTALQEATFDLGLADNAQEADELRVKIQELQREILKLNRLKAGMAGPLSAMALAGRTPGLAGAGPGPWGGPAPTLGLEPVEPVLDATLDGLEDTTSVLADLTDAASELGRAFLDQAGRLLDPTQIASNLASWGIGSLMTLVSGALFGDEPAWKTEWLRAIEANRKALERNTAALQESFLWSIGADVFAGVQEAVQAFLTPGNRYSQDVLFNTLGRFGLTLEDLKDVAQALGLEFVHAIDFYKQLGEMLDDITSADLVGTFSGAAAMLEREFELLDITDPAEKIGHTMDLLGQWITGDLWESLQAVDWTDPNEFLSGLLASIRAGTFDLSQLGQLTPQEFLDIIGQLESFGDAVGSADDELESLTSTLRNAPAGFKIALERYRATTPEIDPRLIIRTDPPGNGGGDIHIRNLNINGAQKNGRALWEEIKREIRRESSQGGTHTLDVSTN